MRKGLEACLELLRKTSSLFFFFCWGYWLFIVASGSPEIEANPEETRDKRWRMVSDDTV